MPKLTPRNCGTAQFGAVVESQWGHQFMVFKTGTETLYRFQPIDVNGCAVGASFLVEKKRLTDPIRRALANGWGNSYIGKYASRPAPEPDSPTEPEYAI